MAHAKLNTKSKLSRFGRAQLTEAMPVVDVPQGKPGVIKNVSVISKGEALGHFAWIDDEMLSQVNAAFASAPKGIKSRFTHPGMCSDGLGKHLGRVTNAQLTGSSVTGDLNFAKSAYASPDGNLAQYVTDLVNDDPQAAGLSISFERDYKAEMEFALTNGAMIVDGEDGPELDMSGFKSPDEANVNNYPHVRLAELRAVDVVDEPAANPNGMFDSNPVARDADKAMAFMLGLSKDKPAEVLFGVNVDRASEFVTRFLANRKLKIVDAEFTAEKMEGAKPDVQLPILEVVSKDAPPSLDSFKAELGKYVAKFGAENGTKWFSDGKTFEQALELHIEILGKDKDTLAAQVKDLTERLSAVSVGTEPLPIAGLSAEKKLPTSISEAISLSSKTK